MADFLFPHLRCQSLSITTLFLSSSTPTYLPPRTHTHPPPRTHLPPPTNTDTKNKDQQLVSATIDNIADAVTHARFVGTDPSSDEVVLMKILHVSTPPLVHPRSLVKLITEMNAYYIFIS